MTEEEARKIYEGFRQEFGGSATGRAVSQPDKSWRFIEKEEGIPPQDYYEGVVVRPDGRAFGFFGALGKVFRNWPALGLPKSNERLLGATELGRYQAFDNGVAIWDGGTGMGFPLIESSIPLQRQLCIVAFFDLRGFTSWSKAAQPDDVQTAIRAFEDAVHIGFPIHTTHWTRQFVKGTGDGIMIVSQADWYDDDWRNTPMADFKPGHAKDFLLVCQRTLSEGRKKLRDFPLAIGCAIAAGPLDRIFLFGRLDLIGPAANDAAKLQQHAWNEICVTDQFREWLERDGADFVGEMELPGKGWRLRPS
jgi:class 3 adenylate cyclase